MSDAPSFHVVLHAPEIPQNAGNVGRTCVAVGAKLWLVRPLGFRVDTHHLRRAGLDYWQHLDWEVVDDWPQLVHRLPRAQSPWLLTKGGSTIYSEVRLGREDVFVFGSESQGLPPSLLAKVPDRTLRIPQLGPVRSLNLASSVAIVVYEAVRQAGLTE